MPLVENARKYVSERVENVGKTFCPVSHDGKDNLRYLWNLWVKMLNQAFYRVMSELQSPLTCAVDKLMCLIIFVRTTPSSVHGIDS